MNVSGHGGSREGAGRKPADYKPPPAKADLDTAKARNESAKADLAELELRIKSGEYVARSEVREVAATALAVLSQSLRSVPDNLERRLGTNPELAAEVGSLIDSALDEVADAFEQMSDVPDRQGDDVAPRGGVEGADGHEDLL